MCGLKFLLGVVLLGVVWSFLGVCDRVLGCVFRVGLCFRLILALGLGVGRGLALGLVLGLGLGLLVLVLALFFSFSVFYEGFNPIQLSISNLIPTF